MHVHKKNKCFGKKLKIYQAWLGIGPIIPAILEAEAGGTLVQNLSNLVRNYLKIQSKKG